MKTIFLRSFFICVFLFRIHSFCSACGPLNTPILTSQGISGSNLVLNWTGNTWYTCSYIIEVEIACNISSFTGTGPFYYSGWATSTGSMYPYPTQYINISALCPGTAYKFRAREVFPPSSYSTWTSTFTFTTPGTFITPTLTVAATPNVICTPATAQLSAGIINTCGPTPATYSWSPTVGLSNPFISNPIASPTNTTTYTCLVNGGTLGCYNASTSVTITVMPPTVAGTASVSSDTICSGNPVTLTLAGSTGSIQWQSATNPGGPWTNIAGATITPFITVPLSADACFRAIVTSCAILISNIVCVTVKPLPIVTVNSVSICSGQTAILTANGGTSYWWSTGSGSSSLNVSPATTTNYTVTGSAGGCTGIAVATVTVIPYPVISVSPAIICGGGNASLNASGANTYLWNTGSSANPLIVSPPATSTYTVTGITSNCSSTATVTVGVFPAVSANFIAPQWASILNPEISFINTSTNFVSWSWNFGEPNAGAANTSSAQNPYHTYSDAGTFCVTLTITSIDGCIDSMIQCLVIEPLFTFYIPNSFSPNGDNVNDEFFGKGEFMTDFEMNIFDRWGNLIFFADDISKHWDGKVGNAKQHAQEDVYIYVVKLKDDKGKIHKYKGTVSLVK